MRRGSSFAFVLILVAIIIISSYSCFPNSVSTPSSNNPPPENSTNQQQPIIITDNISSPQSIQKANGIKSQILFGRWGHLTQISPALSIEDLDKCELDVMDEDGSNQIVLTPANLITSWADWSPDKSKMVIQSNRDRAWKWESDLFIINPDGSNIRKITNAGGGATVNSGGPVYKGPSWSPDGTMIAYAKTYVLYSTNMRAYKYNVYLMNSDGTHEKEVTFCPQGETAELPQWFPDGKRLAYIYSESGFYHIQSIDIVSHNLIAYGIQIKFPEQLGDITNYSLSPDGTKIVFSNDTYRDQNNLGRELFIYDIATGLTTQLTNNDFDDDFPCWSPDGKQILFGRYNWKNWVANSSSTFDLKCDECGLYKINVDGTNERKMPGTDVTFMPIKWR